ncbi:GGDEF domain-containing protein [Lucifera butyrica]|nr:GGDEF domain-containing protein [Lucifera butyrica]
MSLPDEAAAEIAVQLRDNQTKVLKDELEWIILEKEIFPVYQPIVDLKTGDIMGYEALSRGPANSPLYSPLELFRVAQDSGLLFPLEQVCREKAIQNIHLLKSYQQLFLNINADVVKDPHFRGGITKLLIQQKGFLPQQITFEITERTAIRDFNNFSRSLYHYREQGYSIAIDDAGAGYSSLQAIVELRPAYIKIDMSIVQDIDRNPLKQAILEAMVQLAAMINGKIIAEGIEKPAELAMLIKMGVHYAQGYYLARPANPPPPVPPEVKEFIMDVNMENEKLKAKITQQGFGVTIGEIVEPVPTVGKGILVRDAETIFNQTQVNGIVVLEDRHPLGLLMKYKLYFHLGTNYGVSLYYRRPVELVMDKFPLIVNADLPLEAVSQIAMSREEYNLYDYIIVVQDDIYVGVVSIMNLLNNITKLQIRRAHNANPLTGLPGNLLIEDRLKELVTNKAPFAVLYLDLNNFKAFNDKYGFEHGDKVLLFTAQLISRCLAISGGTNDFIGHIGGDDFIIITRPERACALAQAIIEQFDTDILPFYQPEDREKGYIEVKNRRGQWEQIPIVGVSIAIVSTANRPFSNYLEIGEIAAELKKLAKEQPCSNYVMDKRQQIQK